MNDAHTHTKRFCDQIIKISDIYYDIPFLKTHNTESEKLCINK